MSDKSDILLKVVLREDWDMPVSLPIPGEPNRGHFAGRKAELASLTNELSRRKNGAILVSGHRGAGKTSLVHRALNVACQQNPHMLPILVNAGHLNNSTDAKLDQKTLLESIVRRLYSTAHAAASVREQLKEPDSGTFVDASKAHGFPLHLLAPIDDLYRKCVATEFKLTESLGLKATHSHEELRQTDVKIGADFNRLWDFIKVTGWIVATGNALLPVFESPVLRACVSLIAAGLPVFGSIAWNRRDKTSKATSGDFSAKRLYQFDNKLSNLEFDLEVIHRKVRDTHWKLIYVIDELDKVDLAVVKDVIAVCKNLFTLSDAVFIFIGDERLYDQLGSSPEEKVYARAKEYTYFNSRYYIGPPTSEDLEEFLEEIVISKEVEDAVLMDRLKHCMFFEARNDFFDLISAIRGRINCFPSNLPAIAITQSGLSEEDIQKSRLGICIASLYEDKYKSESAAKWRQNSSLLEHIYAHAYKFVPPRDVPPTPKNMGSKPTDEMIRDFDRLLVKLGALKEAEPIRESNYNNAPQRFQYPYIGYIQTEPARKLDMMAEFEEAYMADCTHLLTFLICFVNVWRKKSGAADFAIELALDNISPVTRQLHAWGYLHDTFESKHATRYAQFRSRRSPYPDNREQIEQLQKDVDNLIGQFFRGIPAFFSAMFVQSLPQSQLLRAQLVQHQAHNYFNDNEARLLMNAFGNDGPWLVRNRESKKNALFIVDGAEKLHTMAADIPKIYAICQIVCVTRKSNETVPKDVHHIKMNSPVSLTASMTTVLADLGHYFHPTSKPRSIKGSTKIGGN